ncbi:MAG: DUF5666 domain-containing protein [Terracidiphilus sp.]|nr:DUF5666 domain-containing protein [Terracidiphilus sp.]
MPKKESSHRGFNSKFMTALISMPIALLAGCSATQPTKLTPSANTNVSIAAASTANDAVSIYDVAIKSLSLVSQTGATVPIIGTPVQAEFTHLNGPVEPIAVSQVPQGVYSSAQITVGDFSILCVGLGIEGGVQGQGSSGNGQPANVTITMPKPITVTGSNMTITLNMVLSQFVSNSSCSVGSMPTTEQFEIYAGSGAGSGITQPVDVSPQKLKALQGVIASLNADGTMLTVDSLEGLPSVVAPVPAWNVETNANTVFEGIAAASALDTGLPVEFDATIQPDGSLMASRIAVYDTSATNLSLWSGPLLSVPSSAQPILALGRQAAGPIYGQQFAQLDASQAKFQVSGQFGNLASLPFATAFNASNMVPGQNVDMTFHQASYLAGKNVPMVSTMTLVSQTINGQITAIGKSGAFTTYTVWLGTNDLFANLAFQPGQNNLLTNPRVVTVYADDNTQMLNSLPLGVNSFMRFNGLVFNDAGSLRMDCGQINDGVAE